MTKEHDDSRYAARSQRPKETTGNHKADNDSTNRHFSHVSARFAANKTCKSTTPNHKDQDAPQKNERPSAHGLAAKRNQDNLLRPDVQDMDSEIEDVTDLYTKTKKYRPSSPEIIEVEDASSDDESCSGLKPCSNDARHVGTAHAGMNDSESGQEKDDSEDECSSDDDCESDIEDVTEFMLTKKKEEFLEVVRGAIDLGDSDDEDAVDHGNNTRRKSPSPARKSRKVPQPPIEVFIGAQDIPTCPGMKCTVGREDDKEEFTDEGRTEENDVDRTIKQRIIKLLNTGFHSESNENEARNAMKLARRLIERYNLDQSVLLRERGDRSLNDLSTSNNDSNCPNSLRGGIVHVIIRNRKKGTVLSGLPRWMDFLSQPICANFHVDAFKSISRATKYKKGECTISFYGIKTNAQLAAYAYKVATERISLMASLYEPPATNRTKRCHMRTVHLSYALGIVDGLNRDVTEGLRKDEEMRKSKHKTLEQLECENTAQLALIDHQKKIAEDILKANDVEIRAGRACKAVNMNYQAYKKGIIDSKEIDLNQQALEDA